MNTQTEIASWRLEMCRMVRESCYSVLSGWEDDDTAKTALEVPIETMAPWFVRTDTMLGNMRLAMTMVAQERVTLE